MENDNTHFIFGVFFSYDLKTYVRDKHFKVTPLT